MNVKGTVFTAVGLVFFATTLETEVSFLFAR